MDHLHARPADNRMAYIGASTGIPPIVQARLDAAPGRLAAIKQDIPAAELNLPRLSILFSSGVFHSLRAATEKTRNERPMDCHKMGDFFGAIANLGHQLNTAKLADCQFMIYERDKGDITPIPLPEQTGCIQCHWQKTHHGDTPSEDTPNRLTSGDSQAAQPPSTMPQKAAALQAHERITHIHEQIAQQPHLYHPDLMVSDNKDDVKAALAQGTPAIFVSPQGKGLSGRDEFPAPSPHGLTDPLLIALDFDCTLAGAEGDWLFTQLVSHLPDRERLAHYQRFENVRQDKLLGPGPALTFTQALVGMKKLLALLPSPMDHRLAFALVTARGAATKARVHRNLSTYIPDYQRTLGLRDVLPNTEAANAIQPKKPGLHFMNGQPKQPRLEALQADLYLDDSATHTAQARDSVPTGEILWGPNYEGQRVFELHPALSGTDAMSEQTLPYVMIPPPPATLAPDQQPIPDAARETMPHPNNRAAPH